MRREFQDILPEKSLEANRRDFQNPTCKDLIQRALRSLSEMLEIQKNLRLIFENCPGESYFLLPSESDVEKASNLFHQQISIGQN